MSSSAIQRCSDDELAEADQQLLELGEVDAPAAADALERRVDLRPLHHPPGERRVERGKAERAVLEHLDELAAHPEEEHRPELGVDRAPDDELVAGPVHHRLDGHALEVLGALLLGHRVADELVRVAHGVGVLEVELDTADVGLVRDRVRVQLDDDRVADPVGCRDRLVDRRRDERLGDRDPVRRQELLRLVLGEERPSLGPGGPDDRLGLRPVDRVLLVGRERRRLVDLLQVARQAPGEVEGPDRAIRVLERRDPGLAEDLGALQHVLAAHPGGEHRLAVDPGERDELARRRRRVGHRLRGEDHEEAVAPLVARRDLEGLGIPFRRRVADDVDRVVVAPGSRQEAVELLHRRRRDLAHLAAPGDEGVGGENAGTAGVRHDREAVSGRARLLGQHLERRRTRRRSRRHAGHRRVGRRRRGPRRSR